MFSGFDAYKQVIDSGVDVVLLATPPHFRPQHLAYAVEKGKHAFVEKPIAVDAPGVRSVIETCDKAEAKESGHRFRACAGDITRPCRKPSAASSKTRRSATSSAIESCYNAGTLWHRGDKPEWSRMEYQIRNWLYFTLAVGRPHQRAGDSQPRQNGLAARRRPPGAGIWHRRPAAAHRPRIRQHLRSLTRCSTNTRAASACTSRAGSSRIATSYVDEVVRGTQGHSARILANVDRRREPLAIRQEGRQKNRHVRPGARRICSSSIRDGKPINNGHYMANSTMLAIMGRMCTYTGQKLTWDECFNSQQRLGPSEYAWTDDVPESTVAIPGRTKLV